MPILILNINWAWQASFLSHTPTTLKKYVFSIEVQMLLVSLFEINNPKSAILEKLIILAHSRPQPGQFWAIFPMLRPKIKA